ncbi:hypothetical protein FRB99_001806 [Tulasnella sp. 403]|nr:hypothetical protein FRB99_001806 [Tulasnella sp. 403]
MDVRDDVINSQHDLIKALQQTLRDTHALLISTRQDVLQECRVDIASCASQVFGLDSNVNELQKRVAALEREQLTKEQRFESLAKEIGDVDVAMASERDRVSAMDQRITDLVVRVEEVAGLESANSLPLDGVRSKRRSLVGPVPNRQRQVSTDETSPTDSTAAGFTRDRRLSRASISASIHAVPASAPAHGPTSSNSVNFPTHAPPKGPAFNGMKQDFRFPPRATRHSITTFGHTTASNSVTSASPDSEPETTPEMTRTNTRRSTYDHSGEPEDPIERVTSSEDESSKPEPEPPRLRKLRPRS